MELQDHEWFQAMIESCLTDHDWPDVIDLLQRAKAMKEIVQYSGIPLKEGVLRYAMFKLLDLDVFHGADIDPLTAFADLKGFLLYDLRDQAREKMSQLLKEQLRRGVTFFLDFSAFEDAELKVLIPLILEARMKEIERLEANPPLADVYSTYYGFNLLASGGAMIQESGIPHELQKKLAEVLGSIGKIESLSAKQLKFSPLAFRGCSDYLKMLLWNMLRASLGGTKNRKAALRRLGDLGDQRALSVIESALLTYRGRTDLLKDQQFHDLMECGARIDSGFFLDTIRKSLPTAEIGNSYLFRKFKLNRRKMRDIADKYMYDIIEHNMW